MIVISTDRPDPRVGKNFFRTPVRVTHTPENGWFSRDTKIFSRDKMALLSLLRVDCRTLGQDFPLEFGVND